MVNTLLALIKEKYPLTEIDVGDAARLKVNGMTFAVSAYSAEGLGHISVMRATGIFGLMRMDTLMITPRDIDLPLYSYDRIYAMGNDTLITELYATCIEKCDMSGLERVKDCYTHLEERDPGEHWYDAIKLGESISKKAKKAQSADMDKLAKEHLAAYLAAPAKVVTDTEAKGKLCASYVDGLLQNGGPSTDVFKKKLGEEKTAKLFREILFKTE